MIDRARGGHRASSTCRLGRVAPEKSGAAHCGRAPPLLPPSGHGDTAGDGPASQARHARGELGRPRTGSLPGRDRCGTILVSSLDSSTGARSISSPDNSPASAGPPQRQQRPAPLRPHATPGRPCRGGAAPRACRRGSRARGEPERQPQRARPSRARARPPRPSRRRPAGASPAGRRPRRAAARTARPAGRRRAGAGQAPWRPRTRPPARSGIRTAPRAGGRRGRGT